MDKLMEISFFVDVPPGVPNPAPGGSKSLATNRHTGQTMLVDAGTYNTEWKAEVASVARRAVFNVLKEPLRGALYAQFSFRMRRPKTHFYKDGRLRENAPLVHTFKPDATKLVRAAEDACTGILYSDDALIALQLAEKIYADRVGVEIYVSNRIPTEIKISR